jgi:hypothetical protein
MPLSGDLKNVGLNLLFLGNEKCGFVLIVKNERAKGYIIRMDMI